MRPRIKTVLSVILVLALLIPISAFAEGTGSEPTITVASVQAEPGASVSVDVTLGNNPGIAAAILEVAFDESILTLTSIAYGSSFAKNGEQPETMASPVCLSWSDTTAVSTDGVFATLTFTVAAGTTSGTETPVTVSFTDGDICDIDEDDVSFTCTNGKISVDAVDPESLPQISAGSVEAKAGETVTMDISVANNPGIAAAILSVSFDEQVLTLTSVAYGEGFSKNGEQPETMASPVCLSWSDTTAVSTDGVFATLTFTVNEGATSSAEAAVTVSYQPGDICDINEKDISFICESGKVTVAAAEETIEIDVNTAKSGGATITEPEGGWVEGDNTFTVTNTVVSMVVISRDGGQTYEKVAAKANGDGSYSFTATDMDENTLLEVVVAGDANGDGKANGTDVTRLKALALGKTTLNAKQSIAGDVNGDGKTNGTDVTRMKAVVLGKTTLKW